MSDQVGTSTLYIVAAGLGALSHYLVRIGRWDRRFRSLRFNNKWYYLFSPDVPITGVVVTVTCQHKDQTSLYTGVLESYDFTADGQLELLVLISAARAQLSPNATTTPVFSPIPGERFLLWCRDVNTLNIDYLYPKLIPAAAPSAASTTATGPTSNSPLP